MPNARPRIRRALGAPHPVAVAVRRGLAPLLALLTPVLSGGQQPDTLAHNRADESATRRAPVIVALHVAEPPAFDARLPDAAWMRVDSLTDLRQREPHVGDPASERTVVKVVRDADALYIAVRCDDRDGDRPGAIRATQLRHDADLTSDDYVTLLIDSFHDRRGAFVFRTNPNGAMWDAQLVGVDGPNENWNGIWNVAVRRDAGGWTALFRIPLRTLRFRAGAGASFGFNVERFIRRKNEQALWQSYGRAQGLYHLAAEGELSGLGDLARARGVELRPYALGRVIQPEHSADGVQVANGGMDGKVGLDAKLAMTPTLTADLTANTDFAQVEADRQVINLTRFPLFFPEKREFFLESSGIFDFGTGERAQLFYSRRIGLTADGTPVPILGGARVTGKIGPWAVGVLNARTGGVDAANDAIVRVKRDVLERSYVGATMLQRSGPGVAGAERAAGVDIDLPVVVHGRNVEPKVWVAGTQVPGTPGTPLAWRLSTDYPNDLFDNFVSLYRIDAGFAPTLGFVRRTGIWETTGHIDYMPRPGVLGVRQLDIVAPIPSWDIIAGRDGSLARSRDWQTASFEWQPLGGVLQTGDRFEVHVERLLDAPADTFAVFRDVRIAPGRYWWTRGELHSETSPGRPLSASAAVGWGDFYDGNSIEVTLGGTWRGGGHVILAADATRSSVHLPAGHFVAVQAGGRIEYALNTRTSVLAFVQHNNDDERVDFNLRFHWIPVIGDDVYIVWNSGYTTDPAARYRFPKADALRRPLDGALVVKAVHRVSL